MPTFPFYIAEAALAMEEVCLRALWRKQSRCAAKEE